MATIKSNWDKNSDRINFLDEQDREQNDRDFLTAAWLAVALDKPQNPSPVF